MTDYRRIHVPGACWFFTVALATRRGNDRLVASISLLREAFAFVRRTRPFAIDAIVVLPEHLHCVWTLPTDDSDYSTRWRLLKSHFSRALPATEYIPHNRARRGERSIWQRRFWAHLIVDEADFAAHIDYIHWNPVKHGYVERAADWEFSSFRRFVARGIYPLDWGVARDFDFDAGE